MEPDHQVSPSDDLLDSDLSQAFQQLDTPAPPAAIDAAILAAARTAIQPSATIIPLPVKPKRQWKTPLALAASLLLAVGVSFELRDNGQSAMSGSQIEEAAVAPALAPSTTQSNNTAPGVAPPAEMAPPAVALSESVLPPPPRDDWVTKSKRLAPPAPSFVPPPDTAAAPASQRDTEARNVMPKIAERAAPAAPPPTIMAAMPAMQLAPAPAPISLSAPPPSEYNAELQSPRQAKLPAEPAPLAKREIHAEGRLADTASNQPIAAPAAPLAAKATGDAKRNSADIDVTEPAWAAIRQLLSAGKTTEALAAIKRLQSQRPDLPLPPDLAKWLADQNKPSN